MLSGRFAEQPLQALKARISWDRVKYRLIARRAAAEAKYSEQLIRLGYARDGEVLTLWPSAVLIHLEIADFLEKVFEKK
jgi:hypothetical protein